MPTANVRECAFAYEVLDNESSNPTGVPLVWGHGLTSSRADEDRRSLIDLHQVAEHRRVVRFDARGHGDSGHLTDPEQGRWSEMALDEIGLLDTLGIGDAVLGGASMGTATALHAARHLGSRIRGLILAIPPTAWETRRAQVDMYEQMALLLESKGVEPLIAGLQMIPQPDPFLEDDQWLEQRSESLRSATPAQLAAVFRGAATADLPSQEEISGINTPTLILAWSGDPGHPVSTAERLGELLPDAEVVVSTTADELATWTTRAIAFLRQNRS